MSDFENKIVLFMTALSDMYKDEEEKEASTLAPLELKSDTLTEDFTAMVYAQWMLYRDITGDDIDIFGFTHNIQRLVLQRLLEDNGVKIE